MTKKRRLFNIGLGILVAIMGMVLIKYSFNIYQFTMVGGFSNYLIQLSKTFQVICVILIIFGGVLLGGTGIFLTILGIDISIENYKKMR